MALWALRFALPAVAVAEGKPYMETVSSVRGLLLQPEWIAENWCRAREGEWQSRIDREEESQRTAVCTIGTRDTGPGKRELHLDILRDKIVYVSFFWTEGRGDAKALVDAATALYGKPISKKTKAGCEDTTWDAGSVGVAGAVVEVEDCASGARLNVLLNFSKEQMKVLERDPEAEERARVADWLSSLPDALDYDPALDQLGASREAFRAWCRRTTGKYTRRPDSQACDFGAQIVTYQRTSKLDEMMITWKGFPGSSDSLRELLRVTADEVAARYRSVADKHPSAELKASSRVTEMGDFVATGTLFRDGRAIVAYSIEQRGSTTARATHTTYR